jgi:hypothetical protein
MTLIDNSGPLNPFRSPFLEQAIILAVYQGRC